MAIVKATLKRWDAKTKQPSTKDEDVLEVSFNPQTLRLTYRTSGALGAQNAKDQSATQASAAQATGFSASLSVELFFDTSEDGSNVQNLTGKIAAMMKAQGASTAASVQFQWGDFLFRGTIQSMDETLDFFSESGVPLRSTVSLSVSANDPDLRQPPGSGAAGSAGGGLGGGASFGAGASAGLGASAGVSAGFSASAGISAGVSVGTTPLTFAQTGDSLQSLSARVGADWKAVANANNVDNPRLLDGGTVLNLNAKAQVGIG